MSQLRVNSVTNVGGTGPAFEVGNVVQIVDNTVSSATETYTTVANGVEYEVVSLTMTPKFSTSKLFIDASSQVRIINAPGVTSILKRDGSYIIGSPSANSLAFFYKDNTVNHHIDLKAQGSVISGSTNSTTFSYFIVPFGGTGEVVNGKYGMHYIRIMEVAQ
jgi:hypothetical protein